MNQRVCITAVLSALLASPAVPAEEPQSGPGALRLVTRVSAVGAGAGSGDSPAAMRQSGMASTPATGPTLPSGKLPQYRLDHRTREITSGPSDDPRLRFLLALPGQPVLVEATVTIDGQPFRMAREERIRQLLDDLRNAPDGPGEHQETTGTAGSTDTAETAETAVGAPSRANASADEPISRDEPGSTEVSEAGEATSGTAETAAMPGKADGGKADSGKADGGTEKPEEAAESDAADGETADGETADDAESTVAVTPPSVPPYSFPATVLERLRRQVEVTGEQVSADELRWLLSRWIDGPPLLLLRDHFQRFRATQRPVFQVLDLNRDGLVSADELSDCVRSFQQCDLDRNEVIDFSELERSAEDPRRAVVRHRGPRQLIFLIGNGFPGDSVMVASLYAEIAAACAHFSAVPAAQPVVPRFDTNRDGQFNAGELAALRESSPDIQVTVSFSGSDPDASQLVVEVPEHSGDRPVAAVRTSGKTVLPGVVRLLVDGVCVEFSAVQGGRSDQISLGAVNDGYPLLPEIDPNDDGRLTIRELRSLRERLDSFDANQDGMLSGEETLSTVRVSIGLGPVVHRELAGLRRSEAKASDPATPGPDWFVRMDRNRDNDLSRKEFPGTDAQFAKLDADNDMLISADEARNATD